MSRTFFASDHHFGHANIIKFLDNDGKVIRNFQTIEEHDETIIKNHNAVVSPKCRVYLMGDLAMSRRHIATVGRLNGRKILIKGNHDIFKLKDYAPYFEDIISYRIYPQQGWIFSHIPVYAGQLERRFKRNFHGHLHQNVVDDKRYVNLCMEHTNYTPVSFDQLLERFPYDFHSTQYSTQASQG